MWRDLREVPPWCPAALRIQHGRSLLEFLWIGVPQYFCEGGSGGISPCSERKAEGQCAE